MIQKHCVDWFESVEILMSNLVTSIAQEDILWFMLIS